MENQVISIHRSFKEILSEKAINNPENIATLLVESGIPPSLLKVEIEDLESYFLRTIEMKGELV